MTLPPAAAPLGAPRRCATSTMSRGCSALSSEIAFAGSGTSTPGQWSECFAFDLPDGEFVARLGPSVEDFEADRRAAAFASVDLPVPEFRYLGGAGDDWLAVTRRVRGVALEDLDAAGWDAVMAALFAALDAMATTSLTDTTGFGRWDRTRNAPHRTWRAQLLSVTDDAAPPTNARLATQARPFDARRADVGRRPRRAHRRRRCLPDARAEPDPRRPDQPQRVRRRGDDLWDLRLGLLDVRRLGVRSGVAVVLGAVAPGPAGRGRPRPLARRAIRRRRLSRSTSACAPATWRSASNTSATTRSTTTGTSSTVSSTAWTSSWPNDDAGASWAPRVSKRAAAAAL